MLLAIPSEGHGFPGGGGREETQTAAGSVAGHTLMYNTLGSEELAGF